MTSSGGQLMETTLMTIDISVTDMEDSNNINNEENSGPQQLMVDMECPNCKVDWAQLICGSDRSPRRQNVVCQAGKHLTRSCQ